MPFKKTLVALTASIPTELCRWVRQSVPVLLFGFLIFVFSSSPVWAQSCPLCKTALIGQAESTLEAINLGILVLLFPPLILMSSIVIMAFRHDQD